MANPQKEVREVITSLRVRGYAPELTGGGKIKLRDRTGTLVMAANGAPLTLPLTPSTPNWRRSTLADLRNAGIDLEAPVKVEESAPQDNIRVLLASQVKRLASLGYTRADLVRHGFQMEREERIVRAWGQERGTGRLYDVRNSDDLVKLQRNAEQAFNTLNRDGAKANIGPLMLGWIEDIVTDAFSDEGRKRLDKEVADQKAYMAEVNREKSRAMTAAKHQPPETATQKAVSARNRVVAKRGHLKVPQTLQREQRVRERLLAFCEKHGTEYIARSIVADTILLICDEKGLPEPWSPKGKGGGRSAAIQALRGFVRDRGMDKSKLALVEQALARLEQVDARTEAREQIAESLAASEPEGIRVVEGEEPVVFEPDTATKPEEPEYTPVPEPEYIRRPGFYSTLTKLKETETASPLSVTIRAVAYMAAGVDPTSYAMNQIIKVGEQIAALELKGNTNDDQ